MDNNKQPSYGAIYNLDPVELETLKIYIKTHPKTGFIQPYKSLISALILFYRKPNGNFCLYVDYQDCNNLIIKNRYFLPLIKESLERLRQIKRFTQLDLTNTYYQMRIKECDEWQTAFWTRYGHFEYQVIPFGLSNASASFEGYINKTLAKKLDIFIIIYLNHIFIHIEDQARGHIEAVWWILDFLRKNDLFANLEKCRFHKNEVQFLGYIVPNQGIWMEDERIEAIKK